MPGVLDAPHIRKPAKGRSQALTDFLDFDTRRTRKRIFHRDEARGENKQGM